MCIYTNIMKKCDFGIFPEGHSNGIVFANKSFLARCYEKVSRIPPLPDGPSDVFAELLYVSESTQVGNYIPTDAAPSLRAVKGEGVQLRLNHFIRIGCIHGCVSTHITCYAKSIRRTRQNLEGHCKDHFLKGFAF